MSWFRKSLLLLLCLLFAGGSLLAKKDDKNPDKKPKDADQAATDKKKEADRKKEGLKPDDKKKDKKKKPKDKDKDKDKPKDGDKKAKPENAGASGDDSGRMSLPLVKDHPSRGLKIPYYDTQGNLQMQYNIGIATRIDADHVKMEEMQVETYNEEGEPEMTLELPVSTLDLNTRVITSQTRTTIKRDDFKITGDSVAFNTVTRQGALVGNVHMTIYDLQDETDGKSAAASSAPKAK
jgi:hypothetical protein